MKLGILLLFLMVWVPSNILAQNKCPYVYADTGLDCIGLPVVDGVSIAGTKYKCTNGHTWIIKTQTIQSQQTPLAPQRGPLNYEIEPADIGGAFERGRQQAREAERQRLELEAMRARNQQAQEAMAIEQLLMRGILELKPKETFKDLFPKLKRKQAKQLASSKLEEAEAGSVSSMADYAWLAYHGIGTKKSVDTALEFLGAASQKGHQRSTWAIGYFYQNGIGVSQNLDLAKEYYSKAAKDGLILSSVSLAMLLESEGKAREAIELYQEAAYKSDPNAQFNLASRYFTGLGVPQDIKMAHVWMSLAATNGLRPAVQARMLIEQRMTALERAEAKQQAEAIYEKLR